MGKEDLHVIVGTGPLGRLTAEELRGGGFRVRLVNKNGHLPEPPSGAELVRADMSDQAAALEAVRGASVVYQCSQPAYHRWAREFPALQRSIVRATQAAGAALVVADNLYAYGDPAGRPLTEASPYRPCSRKGEVRRAMVIELEEERAGGRLRVDIVRGSDFFGPWDRIQGKLVFAAALAGKPASLLGRVDQPHTFTYTRDFARTLAFVGTHPSGGTWHVPSGPPLTQAQLIAGLEEILGRPVKTQVAGRLLLRLVGLFDPAAGELPEMLYEFQQPFVMSSEATEKVSGLKATPMETRLRETLGWVAGHPDLVR